MIVALGSDHRGFTLKERLHSILEKLGHEVVDLGGTGTSSIHMQAYQNLVAELGLDLPEPEFMDLSQQIANVEPAVKDALGVSVERLDPRTFRGPREQPKEGRYREEWGYERFMPEGGYWYDVVGSPLYGPITVKDVARHPWPDPARGPPPVASRLCVCASAAPLRQRAQPPRHVQAGP